MIQLFTMVIGFWYNPKSIDNLPSPPKKNIDNPRVTDQGDITQETRWLLVTTYN